MLRSHQLGPNWTKPRPRLLVGPTSANEFGVFLEGGSQDPDLATCRLLLSGDVESNPGPGEQCGTCGRLLRRGNPAYTCTTCGTKSHQQMQCSGLTRQQRETGAMRDWRCRQCRGDDQPIQVAQQEALERGTCTSCQGMIRRGVKRVKCTSCNTQLHLNQNCSKMTRRQIENLTQENWRCERCRGISEQTDPRDTQEKTGENFRTGVCNVKTGKTTISILQWNADGLSSKLEEFRDFVEKHEPDVFCIQETKLVKKDRPLCFTNYTIIRKDRQQLKYNEMNRGGGVITGIKKNIPYREAITKMRGRHDDITEWLTVDLKVNQHRKIRITNAYIPPVRTRTNEDRTVVETTNWPCDHDDMIVGDLNAHSGAWDNEMEDERGDMICDWMMEKSMLALNNREGTCTNRTTGRMTTPDLTIAHSNLAARCDWQIINDLNSDHKPVMTTIQLGQGILEVPIKPIFRWKLKEAIWSKYTEELENRVPNNYENKHAAKAEKMLRKAITGAAMMTIGKKKLTTKSKPWMTQELKTLIKRRNRLRQDIATNRAEWIETCKEISDLTRKTKAARWKEYVENLEGTRGEDKVWQAVHRLEGRRTPKKPNEALKDGETYKIDNYGKANVFMRHYKKVSTLKRKAQDRVAKRAVVKEYRKQKVRERAESPLTFEELIQAISETKTGKSSGSDGIPYELLKNMGSKAMTMMLKICNQCWWEGDQIPKNWRTAVIIPILKEGKDPAIPSSYRPISLTSCLGKIMEKIVAKRLTHLLESRGMLTENQAGFRQNRCTTDQVLKLTQNATDAFNNKQETIKYTAAAFFDFEKAYDKVWRVGLIRKMQDMEIPGAFIAYTRKLLSGRMGAVSVNGTNSKEMYIKEGVPQGSAISPILFIIYINDIAKHIHQNENTKVSIFADDTAIWVRGNDRNTVKEMLQRGTNSIERWANEYKMTLNPTKTEILLISALGRPEQWAPQITVGGHQAKVVDSTKFLGITNDRDLRFRSHLETAIGKAKRRTQIMRCLAGREWGQQPKTQRMLYLTYIRSGLEYGSAAWAPWISETGWKRLEKSQNEALRCSHRLYRSCPQDFINLETGVEPIRERIVKNTALMRDKYLRCKEEDNRRKMTMSEARPRLKTRKGWRHEGQCTLQNMNLEEVERLPDPPEIPPWMTLPVRIINKYLDRPKQEYEPRELQEVATTQLEAIYRDITMYTDGSTDEDQRNGGSGVYVVDVQERELLRESYPAGVMCSSYGGECVALVRALEWMERMYANGETLEVLVVTDSQSLVEAITSKSRANGWTGTVRRKLLESQHNVTVLWVPSHCGIGGNEIADELAKEGTKMNQNDMSTTAEIVKAKIRHQPWTISHERALGAYGKRRKLKAVENGWPQHVQCAYARLRTGHSLELAAYRHRIGKEQAATCRDCGEEEQTVDHMLIRCPAMEMARRTIFVHQPTIQDMVEKPTECRRLLATRFRTLRVGEELETPPQVQRANEQRQQQQQETTTTNAPNRQQQNPDTNTPQDN